MKKKSIISLLIFCMTLGMFTTSCEDMLSPDSERHSYEVAQDTLYSYWGILKSLQNVAERYVILNEVRADLVDGTSYVSDTIAAIMNFGLNSDADKYKDGACAYLKVSDYYHVINSCNAYIANCDTMLRTGTNQQYMIKEYAQVEAIRAWVYLQLVYQYGEVPFYTQPLLTTDAINKFMNDKNHQMANAQNLADLLAPDLEKVEYANVMDLNEIYPQYNNYGDVSTSDNNYICHSTKCMFPISVVLGDLYLLKGDKASCEQAAQHYYNYIQKKQCGPISTNSYYSTGNLQEGEEEPLYGHTGTPWTEKAAVSATTEAITCIPSNKGKLDGKVLTDIGRLFGFEATLRSSGSGDESTSSVSLSTQYERELVPSKGYEALCDSQNYEMYLGDGTDHYMECVTLPGVGDARQSWIYNIQGDGNASSSSQFIFTVGDDKVYGKMVTKQNPNSNFTTTYPMVYRKATVWLRYAEALNRAGFPSYAFAILKTGLCNNDNWFPTLEEENTYSYSLNSSTTFDYPVTDSLYYYYIEDTTATSGYKIFGEDTEYHHYDELETAVNTYYQGIADEANKNLEEGQDSVQAKTINTANVLFVPQEFGNCGDENSQAACYYIDRRELVKAQNTPYLNFQLETLKGKSTVINTRYKTDEYSRNVNTASYPESGTTDNYLTIGIHERGCGILRYDDPDRESTYNYAALVAKKIKENHNIEVTKEDIYNGKYDEYVQEAVEDLIIDEDALELAFEGSRFSDLQRVALRRGDPSYLAKRVAKRGGEMDMSLFNYLNENTKHWYLPFPTDK